MKTNKINYFDEFLKMTVLIEKATMIFIDLIDNYNIEKLKSANEEIHKLEVSSDRIMHNVRKYLISDFLPPIDREDIRILLHKLDAVLDVLDEIAKNFYILNIESFEGRFVEEYKTLLTIPSKNLKKTFEDLPHSKNRGKLLEATISINESKDKADRVYEKHIKKLFSQESDSVEVMKWYIIYKGFEKLFYNYEVVADCVEDLIIKTL